MEMPKVGIVILNYNAYVHTEECLRSLRKIVYPTKMIIVVDNASHDGSGERIRQEFPEIFFLHNESNFGFCKGNNRGIRYAMDHGCDYVLLLNNDTIVEDHFLHNMVEAINREKRIGAACPKIYYYHDPKAVQCIGMKVDLARNGKTTLVREYPQEAALVDVEAIAGSAMLIKREVIEKAGMLDEDFFCFFEDTDYSLRIQKYGYRTVAVTNAHIWHKGGGTFTSLLYVYAYARNQALFLSKHISRSIFIKRYLRYFLYWSWILPMWRFLKKRQFLYAWAVMRGNLDFLLGRYQEGHFPYFIEKQKQQRKSLVQ